MTERSTFEILTSGAVAGFIGAYAGDVIANMINDDRDYLSIRSNISVYYAGVIAGSFGGFLATRVSLFNAVVFSVGFFYVVYDAIDRLFGGTGKNYQTLLLDFITDTIIVYFIIWLQNIYFSAFDIDTAATGIFSDDVILTLITGITVSVYYSFKGHLLNRTTNIK